MRHCLRHVIQNLHIPRCHSCLDKARCLAPFKVEFRTAVPSWNFRLIQLAFDSSVSALFSTGFLANVFWEDLRTSMLCCATMVACHLHCALHARRMADSSLLTSVVLLAGHAAWRRHGIDRDGVNLLHLHPMQNSTFCTQITLDHSLFPAKCNPCHRLLR